MPPAQDPLQQYKQFRRNKSEPTKPDRLEFEVSFVLNREESAVIKSLLVIIIISSGQYYHLSHLRARLKIRSLNWSDVYYVYGKLNLKVLITLSTLGCWFKAVLIFSQKLFRLRRHTISSIHASHYRVFPAGVKMTKSGNKPVFHCPKIEISWRNRHRGVGWTTFIFFSVNLQSSVAFF